MNLCSCVDHPGVNEARFNGLRRQRHADAEQDLLHVIRGHNRHPLPGAQSIEGVEEESTGVNDVGYVFVFLFVFLFVFVYMCVICIVCMCARASMSRMHTSGLFCEHVGHFGDRDAKCLEGALEGRHDALVDADHLHCRAEGASFQKLPVHLFHP